MPNEDPDARTQLLWTGGWDSSFRLMQLLLVEHRAVQPIYVVDAERRSTTNELQTMAKMRELLLERMSDESLLAPVQIILASDYPPSATAIELAKPLRKAGMGSQYVWLTGPAQALTWSGVELCIQRHETGLWKWQEMIFERPGILNGTPEAQLFRYWSFPVLHLTKEEMRDVAVAHGFLDLLILRWFCFTPIGGKPCGRCNPCKLANTEGVTFANPVRGLARDTTRRVAKLGRGAAKKWSRALSPARRGAGG